jgi:hypothetical protein
MCRDLRLDSIRIAEVKCYSVLQIERYFPMSRQMLSLP